MKCTRPRWPRNSQSRNSACGNNTPPIIEKFAKPKLGLTKSKISRAEKFYKTLLKMKIQHRFYFKNRKKSEKRPKIFFSSQSKKYLKKTKFQALFLNFAISDLESFLYKYEINAINFVPIQVFKKTNRRSKAESQDLAVWWLLEYLTTPRPVTKSSANDLAPLHCSWNILFWRTYPASGVRRSHLLGLIQQHRRS